MEAQSVWRWIKPWAALLFLAMVISLGNRNIAGLPPLGKFLNPFLGFWQNAEPGVPHDAKLRLPGLIEPVAISFDRRGVPHIFAQNAHDLYFAQGYVTARDRLWQMEAEAMAAAGRLAEILGPDLLEHDRFQRRMGIPRAAEKALELFRQDGESYDAAEAYAQGVNAYIDGLSPGRWPLEYKLLDYAPSRWTPLNTALIIKHMQWTLSAGGNDLALSNTLAKFGPEFLQRFFPSRREGVPPVIPAGTPWHFPKPSQPVDTGTPAPSAVMPSLPEPLPKLAPDPRPGYDQERKPDPGNGSNNFVISAARTHTGYPLLANDPHLNLSLPSVWYETQLTDPDFSAYGVALPGTPSLLIGFNRKIAWGMTNGQDDVFDWYRLTFRDSTLSDYLQGGKWKPVRRQIEVLHVRGAPDVIDTVIYTQYGPVPLKSGERPWNNNEPALHALRWLALDPSDEILATLRVTRSQDFQEFSDALKTFHCPAQNFAFASTNGDIAMLHHGLLPRKWAGQGRIPLEGSQPGNDWSGWLAREEEPSVLNPPQGWLASANQNPTDSTYPYYLGADFLNSARAERLGQLLASSDSVDVDRAFGFMLDDYDLHAARTLPMLLRHLGRPTLSPRDSAALHALSHWDYRCRSNRIAPVLFDRWWRALYHSVWQDEFGGDGEHYQWPSKEETWRLMTVDPASDWFDDITTPEKETLHILVARAFVEACAASQAGPSLDQIKLRQSDEVTRRSVAPDSEIGWSDTFVKWSRYRPVEIRHLANLPALSRMNISTGGCAECVNALKSQHGPSWRMVVAMDRKPRGYGIYPGGQSGNPGSRHYDDFIDDWAAGRHYALSFMESPSGSGESGYHLLLRGK